MKIDVAGRIRNITLPKSRPLLPVYEAIINSIQAIEDAKVGGTVTIKIFRDTSAQMFSTDKKLRDIHSFEIVDDGIGFNDDNFDAFQTSDTTYKASRGGKGIGRFMWLVAFDRVEIVSSFQSAEKWMKRSFSFLAKGSGVGESKLDGSLQQLRETRVKLVGLKPTYQESIPKRLDTIAAQIVEHCLEYLIRPNPPKLYLVDEANTEQLDLNAVFESEMKANAKPDQFKLGDIPFEILHVRLYSAHQDDHLVHFCANHRAVKGEKLVGRVSDIAKRFKDESGKEFTYASYVDSPILDKTVNSERTAFSLSSSEENLFAEKTDWSEVRQAALDQAAEFLKPYTTPIRVAKEQRLQTFVATEGPMYRPILKYVDDAIGKMDVDVDDVTLDLYLYRAYQDVQMQLKTEGQSLSATANSSAEFESYKEQFSDYMTKVSDVNQADLARYVFHRRLVLEFFKKLLSVQNNGQYALEDRVHEIIFPMGETSSDLFAEQHNLWLVDERLAYHKFLASDKQLRTMKPLTNSSAKEPDIIVFDKACAFVDSVDGPFQNITIIEFKRPRRTNYTMVENPIEQIREYIAKIMAGKAMTPDGIEVPISPGVHFYCYIVADKADRLDHFATGFQFDKTPDGQGYFGYLKHENAYVEIMSYGQMVRNSSQRNAAFFEKLGLPAVMKG